MRCRFAVLLTLVLASRSPAADPIAFGGTTHFRTSATSTIVDLAFSPDGKTIVAGHTQRLGLTAWDAATGAKKWTADLNRELDDTNRLRFVVPVHVLVVGNEVVTLEAAPKQGHRVVRLSLATGERLGLVELPPGGDAQDFRFSPDGTRLAYHEDKTCYVLDAKTGREVWALSLDRDTVTPRSLAFAADGKSLAVSTWSGDLTMFDLATGRQTANLANFGVHSNQTPQYSPDGNWLLARPDEAREGAVWVWNLTARSGTRIGNTVRGSQAAFSPAGRHLLLASAAAPSERLAPQGRVAVYEFPTVLVAGKPLWTVELPRPARAATYSPDGKTIAVASRNAVTLLDAATGRRLPQSAARVGGFTAVATTAEGRVVTLADAVEEWDVNTGVRTRVLPSPDSPGRWTALSANGRFAVWEEHTAEGSRLESWDVAAGKKVAGPIPPDARTHLHGLTTDGRLMLIGRGDEADTCVLKLSNPADSTRSQTVAGSPATSPIRAAVASADGRTLIVQEGPFQGQSGVIDLTYWVQLHWYIDGHKFAETDRYPRESDPVLAVSGDGSLVAMTDEHRIREANGRSHTDRGVNLFVTRPGGGQKPTLRFAIPRNPHLMAFAPDGRTLAVVMDGDAAGYRATIYETASGLLRQECRLPDLGQALAFTPDGSRLVVAAADGPGVIFDLWATGERFDAARDWGRLLGPDGEKAFAAMRAMAADPAASVAFLRTRVKPLPAVSAKVAGWIADLDAPAFAAREAAVRELREVVIDFRGVLEAELNRTASVEVRERLEKILKSADAVGGELLRQYRAVEVLARVGTPEARAVLADVATGDPARRLTGLAKQAMR